MLGWEAQANVAAKIRTLYTPPIDRSQQSAALRAPRTTPEPSADAGYSAAVCVFSATKKQHGIREIKIPSFFVAHEKYGGSGTAGKSVESLTAVSTSLVPSRCASEFAREF